MMKRGKYFLFIVFCTLFLVGCGKAGTDTQSSQLETEEPIPVQQIIQPEGMTVESRFDAPWGYERVVTEEGSFERYLREYEVKEDGAPVLLYNGAYKSNQNNHAAVLKLPINDIDLQQCADSVIRIYSEYYWATGQYDKIAFHFTNGFFCEYTKWMEGYRVVVSGNDVHWEKRKGYDDSYESFENYLITVLSYAGTLSMDTYESETIALSDMEIGDVFLKGGSPGHIVLVIDMCENENGEKAFLLAQGHMPAQEFQVLKNPAHENDPWYYENEMSFPLVTIEYTFSDESMVQRLEY